MKKIFIFSIILFSLMIGSVFAQQCSINEDCTGIYCTISSHKTYPSATCDLGVCKGSGSAQCVVDSCGALCDANTDCACPTQDTCEGPNKIDYPDFGRCGTAGSEGCLCQINTATGGDCAANITLNDPACLAQNCHEIIVSSVCISDGQANVTYGWNYPACGQGRIAQVNNSECGCAYTGWQNEICIANGKRAQTRVDYTEHNYCNELYQEIDDPTCACQASETHRVCLSAGISHVAYSYNFQYCGSPYTNDVPDDSCLCNYTGWTNIACVEDGKMRQQRNETTDYSYCTQPLSRDVDNQVCSCSYITGTFTCIGDGIANFGCTWNYPYCGSEFTLPLPELSCLCNYTDWTDSGCLSNGTMGKERFEKTDFSYCQNAQTREVDDTTCSCVLSESSFVCKADGFADVTYAWNHEYCGQSSVVSEPRQACSCVYTDWQDDICVSDGVRRQNKYETTDFPYCENRLIQGVTDTSCSCAASEHGRVCASDGKADVNYIYNFDYCPDDYILNENDTSCQCLYDEWLNMECVSDGVMRQNATKTSQFGYCPETNYQAVPNDTCSCEPHESSRVCAADGVADVTYQWSFIYCPAQYTQPLSDAACDCVYTAWTDGECVADSIMKQIRSETSGYQYCDGDLDREINDTICGCLPHEESRECVADGYADVNYNWNFGYCPESYINSSADADCNCVYSEWTTVGCVGFKQRGFSREKVSGYPFCTASLYKVEKDGTCDTIGDNGNIGGIGISPDNFCPEILEDHGVSVSYVVDTYADQQTTIIEHALLAGRVGRSYAFEGETINFTAMVFDKDGIIDDCVHVYVTLDNGYDPVEAGCRLAKVESWTDPHTGAIYNDSLGYFECTYTVEPTESGTYGEYWISVMAADACGAGCKDNAPGQVSLYLNPAVSLTIDSQDTFGFLYSPGGNRLESVQAGAIVYSPYFKIENSADAGSGLYMLLKLYGTDMYDYGESAAKCPDSNILTADNIEYKASHLNVQQPWTTMPRNSENADYVFNDFPSNAAGNFLGVGDDITMRLRLNIPTPCTGTFMDGGQIVFVGEVI